MNNNEHHFLAIDLGAESGRGILATYADDRLALREVGRFATGQGEADPVIEGLRHWDFDRIWSEIERIVLRAEAQNGGALDGVGVDSWGVDFGLIDGESVLLKAPVQYRDHSHARSRETLFASRISRSDLWRETGIQPMPFNTIFQLAARCESHPQLLRQARHLLMIPDLVHWRLTQGESLRYGVEFTNASTTAMLKADRSGWDAALLARLGLPHQFLGPVHQAGTRLGATRGGTPVYAPATHDTASAVVAVPADAQEQSWAFLSSGTWSLLGTVLPSPIMSDDALHAGYSNEGGVGGSTRFLKNIMGLWLVQECRRSINRAAGRDYSYPELTALAEQEESNRSIVNAAADRFLAPEDMPGEIRAACRETGQPEPESPGELIRCCLDSLAHAYKIGLENLQQLTGRAIDTLHIVGGGTQNRLLNQLAADACGIRVTAGPAEATAIGNIIAQMVGAGAIGGYDEGRSLVRRSFEVETYSPR